MRASAGLLATAGLCIAGLLSRTALAANAPGAWSDLWHTPDQQGQALLDAGQPAQAADLFRDPRRRAYADLEAGRYAAAAKQLGSFDDPRSEYNRGNALARSGNLEAALAAYDAALKQAPADGDTRHNRELVERALQQQRQSQRPRSGNGRQDQKPGQSGGQKQGGSGSQQPGKGSQSGGKGQPGTNGSQADRTGKGAQQQATASGSNSYEAPGQAQRDAAQAAALARAQRERGAHGKTAQGQDAQRDGTQAGGTDTPKQRPESERQLALDQWLRQIPDSAAGLLQRKFLIEHMMRQQDGGQ